MNGPILPSADSREEFDAALDAAIQAAIEEALACPGKGILVTRHDHRTFTVELTQEVPFGTTLERDLRKASH